MATSTGRYVAGQTLGLTVLANRFLQANRNDHELAASFFEALPGLLAEGTIKPNAATLRGGLDDVRAGFQEYRDGKVSNYKIVYQI